MLGSHSSRRIDLRHAPSHFNAKFLSTPKWVALLAIFILWGEQMKGGCLTFEPPSIKPQIKEPFWKANRRAHESEGNGSFDSQLLRPPEESPTDFQRSIKSSVEVGTKRAILAFCPSTSTIHTHFCFTKKLCSCLRRKFSSNPSRVMWHKTHAN